MNVRREPIRERLACIATIASVNTCRLVNVRERKLHERSPDALEHRLNVSQTFPDGHLADVRESMQQRSKAPRDCPVDYKVPLSVSHYSYTQGWVLTMAKTIFAGTVETRSSAIAERPRCSLFKL